MVNDQDAAAKLDALAETWLQPCGSCDAGLTTNCTCAEGDPRTVIADLIREARQLRANLDEAEAEVERLSDAWAFAIDVADLDRPSQMMRRRMVTLPKLIERAKAATASVAVPAAGDGS